MGVLLTFLIIIRIRFRSPTIRVHTQRPHRCDATFHWGVGGEQVEPIRRLRTHLLNGGGQRRSIVLLRWTHWHMEGPIPVRRLQCEPQADGAAHWRLCCPVRCSSSSSSTGPGSSKHRLVKQMLNAPLQQPVGPARALPSALMEAHLQRPRAGVATAALPPAGSPLSNNGHITTNIIRWWWLSLPMTVTIIITIIVVRGGGGGGRGG